MVAFRTKSGTETFVHAIESETRSGVNLERVSSCRESDLDRYRHPMHVHHIKPLHPLAQTFYDDDDDDVYNVYFLNET
jgi:hypothetical protein